MKKTYGKQFFIATAERAVKTCAQSAVAMITAGATGLLDVDWVQVASVSGLAAVVSVLTSIASGASDGQPSLAGEHLYVPQHAEE